MKHGAKSGAMTRWQEEGSPRIPAKRITSMRSTRVLQRVVIPGAAVEARKGWVARGLSAVGRFLQRRRA